jgi:hypothetical protein
MQFNRNSKCNNEVYNFRKEIPCNAEKETTHLVCSHSRISSRWVFVSISISLDPLEMLSRIEFKIINLTDNLFPLYNYISLSLTLNYSYK